jgi:hypothetical protein
VEEIDGAGLMTADKAYLLATFQLLDFCRKLLDNEYLRLAKQSELLGRVHVTPTELKNNYDILGGFEVMLREGREDDVR